MISIIVAVVKVSESVEEFVQREEAGRAGDAERVLEEKTHTAVEYSCS